MILLDSNIFMYAAGAAHPHKLPSVALLERVTRGEVDAFVDAEVLQGILHRYRAIGRWEQGGQVYDLTRKLVPMVVPITSEIMDAARVLLGQHDRLTARDAVHAAVCLQVGEGTICSYDRDYDALDAVRRLEPPQVLGAR